MPHLGPGWGRELLITVYFADVDDVEIVWGGYRNLTTLSALFWPALMRPYFRGGLE